MWARSTTSPGPRVPRRGRSKGCGKMGIKGTRTRQCGLLRLFYDPRTPRHERSGELFGPGRLFVELVKRGFGFWLRMAVPWEEIISRKKFTSLNSLWLRSLCRFIFVNCQCQRLLETNFLLTNKNIFGGKTSIWTVVCVFIPVWLNRRNDESLILNASEHFETTFIQPKKYTARNI